MRHAINVSFSESANQILSYFSPFEGGEARAENRSGNIERS